MVDNVGRFVKHVAESNHLAAIGDVVSMAHPKFTLECPVASRNVSLAWVNDVTFSTESEPCSHTDTIGADRFTEGSRDDKEAGVVTAAPKSTQPLVRDSVVMSKHISLLAITACEVGNASDTPPTAHDNPPALFTEL
jgi:hypothetical protein